MLSLLRHGFVSLRRSPTLALAATVLVFSFLNNFLLRPLPYGDAARLVVVYEHSIKGGRENSSRVTYGNATAVADRMTSFSRRGIFRNESATFLGATLVPARRAAKVSPITALRAE